MRQAGVRLDGEWHVAGFRSHRLQDLVERARSDRAVGAEGPTAQLAQPSLGLRRRAARRRPGRLIWWTSPARPCTASLNLFAPNVLVSMQSAPAAMYSLWTDCTTLAWLTFRTSKQASMLTPRA